IEWTGEIGPLYLNPRLTRPQLLSRPANTGGPERFKGWNIEGSVAFAGVPCGVRLEFSIQAVLLTHPQ
ncbi:MAG: hypothetical protein ACREDR_33915, partial [Blastocatellia bacterium]